MFWQVRQLKIVRHLGREKSSMVRDNAQLRGTVGPIQMPEATSLPLPPHSTAASMPCSRLQNSVEHFHYFIKFFIILLALKYSLCNVLKSLGH